MVSDFVKVESKSPDSEKAYCWSSKGVEGYKIEECEKEDIGTKITLHIKEDSDEERYSQFLEEYTVQSLIKRYSDYIHYPIQMDTETINSMTPIWKKEKKKIKDEEYEKGLQLYANGVLIMEKCEDLLPDYFGFVKGLVDSEDLSLNISREMLQHDRQLRVIAKNIENKIKSELENLLKNDRDKYE